MGVHPVLESRDISNPNVEYLGVMAWAAQFQWIPDKSGPADLVEMRLGTAKCKVGTNNYLRGGRGGRHSSPTTELSFIPCNFTITRLSDKGFLEQLQINLQNV